MTLKKIVVDLRTRTIREEPIEAPEPVSEPLGPPSITRRQLRLWLVRNGYTLEQVGDFFDSLPEPQRAEAIIEWQETTQFELSHPLLQQLGEALFKLTGKKLERKLLSVVQEASRF